MTVSLTVALALAGLALVGSGLAVVWRCARGGAPLRAGPWPGLTPRGAAVLLGCALLLAGGQLIFAAPTRPLPDLPILAAASFVPMAVATRLTQVPGAAAAVCGAYLLPRSLLSLVDPALEPPPLLLVPAVVFDVSLWLRPSDLASLGSLGNCCPRLRRRRTVAPKRNRAPRQPTPGRYALAGGLFGLTLAAIEPPLLVLLGADPATWSAANVAPAATVSAAACGACAMLARSSR